MTHPLPGLVRDLHPLDDTHAGQTKEEDDIAIHPLLTNPLFDNHFHTFSSNFYDSNAVWLQIRINDCMSIMANG